MLELVLGASGCGKTYYSRQETMRAAIAGERPILIVPEQFSFESERAMLSLLGADKVGLSEVYSFSRLAEIMNDICGVRTGAMIDASGRAAAMCVALSQLGDHLDLYKGKRSSYFIEHLLGAVKEFKLYSLSPDMLKEAAALTDGSLKKKLDELSLIYSAYDAIVERCALDPLDDLNRLCDQLTQHRFFEGRTVIVDSFRSFTGQQLGVLSHIIAQSARCVVTVCSEDNSDENGLFASGNATVERLKAIAKKHSVAIAPPVRLYERHRYTSEALAAMESSVFRYSEQRISYDEPTSDITICKARDRYDEVEYCARECRRLLREEGYRCRDIAIIARSEDTYKDIVADAMEQQDIPCFMDRRIDTASGAVMQLVISALNAVVYGWQTDDLLRLLKTGLIEKAEQNAVDELENYCFVWSIKGSQWREPFIDSPEGFDNAPTESDQKRLESINKTRKLTVSLLTELSEGLKNTSGREMARAVYSMLENAGAATMLDKLSRQLPVSLKAEQEQLWRALMSLLDQIAAIVGDAHISPADFAELMSLMIEHCDIGHIPRGLDEVTFGGADRVRVTAPRAVFVVGVCDGEFPAAPSGSGVFTDDERKRLLALELPLADTMESQLLDERLLFYTTIASPSERLYVTYPQTGSDGQLYPSEGVGEILSCVPKAVQIEIDDSLQLSDIEGADNAFELSARHWNDGSTLSESLKAVLLDRAAYNQRMKEIESEQSGGLPALRSAETAGALFGNELYLSASKVEQFFSCRFKFLCEYGLRLKQKKRADLDSLSFGNVTHYVLEKLLGNNADSMDKLTDTAYVESMVAELLERYMNEQMGGTQARSKSLLYRVRRMKKTLSYLVVNIANELSDSDFRPIDFELPVGRDGRLIPADITAPDGTVIHITGKVDRVDLYERDGKKYIRIIDYKTGSKKFKLSDVLSGLNMQMLIYLSVLGDGSGSFAEQYRDAIPAGILYCPAYVSNVKGSHDISEQKLMEEQANDLKRDGLVFDDSDDFSIAQAMEKKLKGKYIPIKLKKDLQLDSRSVSRLISVNQYEIIKKYVRDKIRYMGGEVKKGNIQPSPVESSYDMCGSCDYYPVCRYSGLPTAIEKYDNTDTIDRMSRESE